ncbi:MAG: Ig-like domain-containing protein, partial [Lysobacterales bacterium]
MNRTTFGWMGIAVLAILGGCGGGGSGGGTSPPPPPPPPPPPVDSTAPMVSGTLPADLAVDADRLGNVTATFDEGLNAATVNGTNFTVVDADGAA